MPCLLRGAKHLPPDAAEAVDADANCHVVRSPVVTTGRPKRGARPKVTKLTMRAPPSCSAAAHAFRVAAVVTTSSTRTRWQPRSDRRSASERNAPATLRCRSPGVNRVWVVVARVRASKIRAQRKVPPASEPRSEHLALVVAALASARRCERHRHERRALALDVGRQAQRAPCAAPSRAPSACQPPYLSACTMDSAAPPGIAYTERAARTNGGSSGHHTHDAEGRARLLGCPHRSQRGRGSSRARTQHAPQTSSRSCAARARPQTAHAAGRSRSNSALRRRAASARASCAARSTSRCGRARCRTSARTTSAPCSTSMPSPSAARWPASLAARTQAVSPVR